MTRRCAACTDAAARLFRCYIGTSKVERTSGAFIRAHNSDNYCSEHLSRLLCPAPNRRGIKRWCCLTSVCLTFDVCLSRTLKSRTERPRKTKIGTEVAHVTRDSDITFKVKVTGGGGILWRPSAQLVYFITKYYTGGGLLWCDILNQGVYTTVRGLNKSLFKPQSARVSAASISEMDSFQQRIVDELTEQ